YIYIQSNVKHRLIVAKNNQCRMLNIEFIEKNNNQTGKDAYYTKVKTLLEQHHQSFILNDDETVYFTLSRLVLELDHKSNENQLLIDNLMLQLLLWIDRARKEHNEHADNFYIKEALTYIHEHYDTEIKVDDIANVTHLHPSYLHRIFKMTLNKTINEYITKVRIDKAKMLLMNTEIPVTDISNFV